MLKNRWKKISIPVVKGLKNAEIRPEGDKILEQVIKMVERCIDLFLRNFGVVTSVRFLYQARVEFNTLLWNYAP